MHCHSLNVQRGLLLETNLHDPSGGGGALQNGGHGHVHENDGVLEQAEHAHCLRDSIALVLVVATRPVEKGRALDYRRE